MYQTIQVTNIAQAEKLAERLCKAGYFFICQMARVNAGRIFTVPDTIDFYVNKKLFTGVNYTLETNPSNTPTTRYNVREV
jgi:hypothetical protein